MSDAGFRVAWTATSGRTLARLPEKAGTTAVEFIYGSMAASPYRVGKPLRLGLEGLYSAGRGDYRVTYRIEDNLRTVTVMAIEHRSDAYRPRKL